MKNLSFKTIIAIIFLCFLFYNSWVEEVLDEKKDFLTYEKPISEKDLKQKIHAPFEDIPKYFEELHTEFESIMQEKNDFDKYFNEIIQIEKLSERKDVQAKYKVTYLSLHQHVAEFSNILMSLQTELNKALSRVERICEDLRQTYNTGSKKNIIDNEYDNMQKEYSLYIEWLFVTVRNTATILNDINLANIKFESKINEELKLEKEIPSPQKITNYARPKIASVQEDSLMTEKKAEAEVEKEEDIWQEIVESDIKEDKEQSDKLYESGNKLFKEEKYENAINDYKESVKCNKKNFWAIAGISKVYIKTKEYDDAIFMINKAIEIFKTTRKKKK